MSDYIEKCLSTSRSIMEQLGTTVQSTPTLIWVAIAAVVAFYLAVRILEGWFRSKVPDRTRDYQVYRAICRGGAYGFQPTPFPRIVTSEIALRLHFNLMNSGRYMSLGWHRGLRLGQLLHLLTTPLQFVYSEGFRVVMMETPIDATDTERREVEDDWIRFYA